MDIKLNEIDKLCKLMEKHKVQYLKINGIEIHKSEFKLKKIKGTQSENKSPEEIIKQAEDDLYWSAL